jgi:uncharacterized damage-inducible protein DinB
MADMVDAVRASVREILGEQKASMREIVSGLGDEGLNWLPAGNDETNSIAQMLSHALEAERFLAATAVDATVDRDREAQFQVSGVSEADLLSAIDHTEATVNGFLGQLTAEHLSKEIARPGRSRTGGWWLLHAVEHSREHVGQAYLTRQLYEGRPS